MIAGCGDGRPSVVPVAGTLTLNGVPVSGAQIGFEPENISGYNRPSMAMTDSEGKFKVGTFGQDDGMPKGKYKVSVFKKDIIGEVPESFNSEDTAANVDSVEYQWTVPQKYSNTSESGITIEVTSSGMTPDTIALTGEAEMELIDNSTPAP